MNLTDLPPKLKYAIGALISVMGIGMIFYHYVEKWNWIDAAFFATSTITTVGYGNVVPTTPLSKVFTIAYMLIGIGIALYSLSMIGGYYMEQRFESRIYGAATSPREQLRKLRCAITPGHGYCNTNDAENKTAKKKKVNS